MRMGIRSAHFPLCFASCLVAARTSEWVRSEPHGSSALPNALDASSGISVAKFARAIISTPFPSIPFILCKTTATLNHPNAEAPPHACPTSRTSRTHKHAAVTEAVFDPFAATIRRAPPRSARAQQPWSDRQQATEVGLAGGSGGAHPSCVMRVSGSYL